MSLHVRNKDCFDYIKKLPDNSIDAIITDPPYFLETMSNEWTANKKSRTIGSTIKNLPSGMKFDIRQAINIENFIYELSIEALRVLKPGGFYLLFSSPRLYHGLACGVQRAGFEIRDQLIWSYNQSQVKAVRLNHFIDKNATFKESVKKRLKKVLENFRTPQIRTLFEPICMAMKPLPKGSSFLNNWKKNGTGLIYVNPEKSFPTSIIHCPKPNKKERNKNNHPTVKPISLMKELIEIFCPHNGSLLDPFLGSGTTVVAALEMNKTKKFNINIYGSEKNKEYFNIIKSRINKTKKLSKIKAKA